MGYERVPRQVAPRSPADPATVVHRAARPATVTADVPRGDLAPLPSLPSRGTFADDRPTRIRISRPPDAGTTIRRTIHKGLTARSEAYTRIRQSGLYQEPWSDDQRALIEAMHRSKHSFVDTEVRAHLAKNPLPTIADIEKDKVLKAAVALLKVKRNAAAKAKQKRKSTTIKKKGAGQKFVFTSHVNFKKPHRQRTIKKADVERGSELVELGRVLLREALGSTDSNTMQEVAAYINQMQTGNLTQQSARIGGVHLSTNTQNLTTQPTDAQGYLAMTHVSLSGTDQRSDYSAFAKPDTDQAHGSLHPLEDPSSNPSFALLNAVEAVRNHGQFVMSMLLKHLALKSGTLQYGHAVNPFKFGTHEVKGAAGQDRADFADMTAANTSYLLDLLLDAGGSSVATALQSILERKAKGEDTKDAETAVLVELQKILLSLTTMDTT